MADDNYYFLMGQQSQKVIDVEGAGTGNKTPLQIYQEKSSGTGNQLWKLADSSEADFYFLMGQQSQKVMDVQGCGTGDGTQVQIYEQKSKSYDNQLWQIVQSSTAGYYFVRGQQSQKVLTAASAKSGDNPLIQIYEQKSSDDNQLWQFTKHDQLLVAPGGVSPDPISIYAGFTVVVVLQDSTSSGSIYTCDDSGSTYPLFGGDSNTYTISDQGTPLTVRIDAPEGAYSINYIPPKKRDPVRGTINVKKSVAVRR